MILRFGFPVGVCQKRSVAIRIFCLDFAWICMDLLDFGGYA